MSVHPFKKSDCDCPVCEIFNVYFDDVLNADSPEDLEQIVRSLIRLSYDEGLRDCLAMDIANKVELLQALDEED
jgi:hypothetical protein